MNEYSLYMRKEHMPHLLEALRLHRVSMENASATPEIEKALMDEITRRAELLEAVMDARSDLQAAQAAYDAYIEEGGGRH